jgi:hypothetical protein
MPGVPGQKLGPFPGEVHVNNELQSRLRNNSIAHTWLVLIAPNLIFTLETAFI